MVVNCDEGRSGVRVREDPGYSGCGEGREALGADLGKQAERREHFLAIGGMAIAYGFRIGGDLGFWWGRVLFG